METKKFSKFEISRLKRTAQNVDQYIQKKNKLTAQIGKLQAELDEVIKMIEITDAPTKMMTGYSTEELIKKVITDSGKLDKNGCPVKYTTYELIYPDTVVPVKEETVVGELPVLEKEVELSI